MGRHSTGWDGTITDTAYSIRLIHHGSVGDWGYGVQRHGRRFFGHGIFGTDGDWGLFWWGCVSFHLRLFLTTFTIIYPLPDSGISALFGGAGFLFEDSLSLAVEDFIRDVDSSMEYRRNHFLAHRPSFHPISVLKCRIIATSLRG